MWIPSGPSRATKPNCPDSRRQMIPAKLIRYRVMTPATARAVRGSNWSRVASTATAPTTTTPASESGTEATSLPVVTVARAGPSSRRSAARPWSPAARRCGASRAWRRVVACSTER